MCYNPTTCVQDPCRITLNGNWNEICYNVQGRVRETMAQPTKSRGCGRRPQATKMDTELGLSKARRDTKFVERLISDATIAYREETNEEIHKMLEDWEEEVKEE